MENTDIEISRVGLADITAHQNLKRILKSISDRITLLKRIILANPYPVAIWDKKGHFVAGNRGYKDLFTGVPPEDYSIFNDPVLQNLDVYDNFLEIKKGDIQRFPAIFYNSHLIKPEYPDNPIWFETTMTPIVNENDEIECFLFHYIDVTEIMKMEDENRELKERAEKTKKEIKKIISDFDKEKKEIKTEIIHYIQCIVLPVLQKIKTDDNSVINLNQLKKIISEVPENYYKKLLGSKINLTPTEIKICELVRIDLSGKEIAEALNISISTLHSHKNNIRKKMDLTGSPVKLKDYLMGSFEPILK